MVNRVSWRTNDGLVLGCHAHIAPRVTKCCAVGDCWRCPPATTNIFPVCTPLRNVPLAGTAFRRKSEDWPHQKAMPSTSVVGSLQKGMQVVV